MNLDHECTVFQDSLHDSAPSASPTALNSHPASWEFFFLYSEEVHIDGHAEEKEAHEYYNEIPGKQPPAGGVSDVRVRVQATEKMAYCPIRCEKLCYLVSNVLLPLELAVPCCAYHCRT